MTRNIASKKGIIFTLIIALVIAMMPSAMANETPIKLIVNGKEVAMDVAPQLINNRTMVPVRFVSEALGETISWDQEKRAVLINSDASQAGPRGDEIQLIVNGKAVASDVPPLLIDNRTMVPVRFVSEALGSDVKWDSANRIVRIEARDQAPKEPVEKLVVTDEHTIDRTKKTIEEQYMHAKKISILDMLDAVDYGDGITRSGTHFANTLEVSGGASNRLINIGLDRGEGLFDLSAITNHSGQVAVHIHATVDVTRTTNGMYFTMKSDSNDNESYATPRPLIDWRNYTEDSGQFETIIKLETTLWHVDEAYIEILLPYQAEVTIHNIYMFMEKEVPGFSDMHERITGGTGATDDNIHVVGNASELVAAADKVKAAKEPSIIYVDGTISYDDFIAVTGNSDREISFGSEVHNLSIVGVADRGVFDGVGIKIHGHNVIVENLTIQYVAQKDTLQINDATDVWIRHNSFVDGGRQLPEGERSDELMSIKNNAQHVIVSWNHFKDSNRALLIGSNDGIDALPDRRVIIHHNYFENLTQRVPLFRGGHGHIYNNYFKDIDFYAVGVRFNSKLRIENNYYVDVRRPILPPDENPGHFEANGNIYKDVRDNHHTESTIQVQFKDYHYTLDATEDVPSIVMSGAGAGKIEQDLR